MLCLFWLTDSGLVFVGDELLHVRVRSNSTNTLPCILGWKEGGGANFIPMHLSVLVGASCTGGDETPVSFAQLVTVLLWQLAVCTSIKEHLLLG